MFHHCHGSCSSLPTSRPPSRVGARLVLLIAGAVGPANSAHAQCDPGWKPGMLPESILGANGAVHAMIEWTPPGQPSMLVIGGEFTRVGNISAHHIAAWDGQKWRAFGEGFNDAVYALTVWNNSLIAGGTFELPVRRLGQWTGSAWFSLGGIGPTYQTDDSVNALAVFNGELYVGGVFCCVNGDIDLKNGARFDGTTWRDAPAFTDGTEAYQVFDDDGNGPNPPLLYAGGRGTTTNITRWNGTSGVSMPSPNGDVYAMTVVNAIGPMPGGLIVGGAFTHVPNPAGGNFLTKNIARFDGTSFSTLRDGVGLFQSSDYVDALRAYGSFLYVGGSFLSADDGTVPAINLAKWNGSAWSVVSANTVGAVSEMRQFGSDLMIAGSFSNAGGVSAYNLMKWTGSAYSPVTTLQQVNAIWPYGTSVAIGGLFNHDDGEEDTSNTSNIAVWNGHTTRRLGWGVNGRVNALSWYSTPGPFGSAILVAGGEFTAADGGINGAITANRIAYWVENSLTPAQWEPLGSGFNSSVHALAQFNGSTVAGGSFTASGATSVPYLAKYSGSPATWQPLTTVNPGLNGAVLALKSFSDALGGTSSYLVIGGSFTSAPGSGVAASRVLLRRESPIVGESAWQALGAGFNNTVYALERYGNGLNARTYAGGAFTLSGGITVNRIARLNGANWEAVGTGVGFNNVVLGLRASGADLYATGLFTSVDGISVNGIAKWNGTAWSAVEGGLTGTGSALLSYQTELLVGGSFTAVNAGSIPSHGVARWERTGLPWVTQQPVADSADCGTYGSFIVRPPSGYVGSFQWRKGGVNLVDGLTPAGTYVQGASGTFDDADPIELGLGLAQPAEAGSYDCVLTTACGSVTSTAATFTVTGTCASTCPADIAPVPNGDNIVNVQDLLAVIAAWGACANPNACPADIAPAGTPVGDDIVNVQDLLAMIAAWGACP